MLRDVDDCLHRWDSRASDDEPSRWQTDVDPDELEYVATALFHLDAHLSGAPAEATAFYLMLVRAVLRSLELESPARAAFADQLRWSWPSAAAGR